MKILLDTHCWLWGLAEPERLGRAARALIADPANDLFLSAASSWEIAIKAGLGKLRLPEPPWRYVPHRLATQGITALAVEHAHALQVAALPHHHRDPFDRLLVAQAQVEGLTLLTADRALEAYEVEIVWADESSWIQER